MPDLARISQLEGNLSPSHVQQIRARCGSDVERYQQELEQETQASNAAIQKQRSGYLHPTEGWVSGGWPD